MEELPLVSIALCTYNGEKYISKQLDSILNQTYRNLEIIIADDYSSDDTYKIVGQYAKKDSRITCFKNDINIGFNKNFEYAIKLTTGDYISICDQDDIWLPQKIEILLNNIGDNWLVFSNSSYINTNDGVIKGRIFDNFNPESYTYKAILLANFVTGHTTLFKREFVNYFAPIPLDGFYDWWLGFIALYHKKIIYLDEVLTLYRIHQSSVMQLRSKSGKEKQEENKTTYSMLSIFLTYKNLQDKDRTFIEQVKNVYKQNFYSIKSFPLIKMIIKNYRELFPGLKKRERFSLLNFAFKYARKVKNKA